MTLSLNLVSGFVLIMLGANLVHLASPHQKLMRVAGPRRPVIAAVGTAMLAIATLLLVRALSFLGGIFTALTLVMLLWSVPPLAIAWLRQRREARP